MFTPREAQLLPFLFHDKKLKAIANEMHLDFRTIDMFQTKIFKKVGVETRIGLIIAYYTDSSVHAKLQKYIEKEV